MSPATAATITTALPRAAFHEAYAKSAATTRVYTIHYAPRVTTTLFAVEYEIVNWTTEVIDHADGSTECIATPVYTERPPREPVTTYYPTHETIETTDALDIDKLLALKYACAVTCHDHAIHKITTATVAEPEDEATASESDDGEETKFADIENEATSEEVEMEEAQPHDEASSDCISVTSPDSTVSVWPALIFEAVATTVQLDWTIQVYQRDQEGRAPVTGSLLLQRRLLAI